MISQQFTFIHHYQDEAYYADNIEEITHFIS